MEEIELHGDEKEDRLVSKSETGLRGHVRRRLNKGRIALGERSITGVEALQRTG